ncbi:MAG TPA: polysaccharide deacetylase family protein [Gemmatimonadaceae bacterium]|jgi:Predicted xylanase/chitin deacetylase|nr:polysaccharide deacetylase family protein [Gemmatimonadaceae bacterium]
MRAILTYHSIDSSGSPVSVSEETFRAHVRFLGSGRVGVVPLADLPALPDEEDAVALTFDDGFLNFSRLAMPLLVDLGLPATVFVVSDAVGTTNAWGGREVPGIPTLPLMGWKELHSVRDAGFEIGAHTRHHPDLTTVSGEQLEDETAGCVDRISAELGERPHSFAYPYGAVNEAVARHSRRLFERSVTTELRPLAPDEDTALLPRLDAWYFRGPGALEGWGTSSFRRRLWIRAQGRRVRALVTSGGRGR